MANQATKNICTLTLKNIKKTYGEGENKVLALKGVSMSFRKSEFVSILGPSGCGKTTLLNIIGGLDRYSDGDLIINGKYTRDYDDKDWDAYRNNSIGFVFQSYNLIPHQTVLSNVELALKLSGISKAECKERAIKMLEKVGLKDHINKKPNQLSGGQMQRVAIARALINDPDIILADEPTGALDTETSIQVMELLKEVAKDRLVIMVTHNPELAKEYSTRIIRLLDGKVVGDTNPVKGKIVHKKKKNRKPKMGFKIALSLSVKNLFSKKTRTVLTSIAGSIGIIGVALVLALSNGFNIYMTRMQTETLSSYPLTISESSVDLSTFTEIYENDRERFPEFDNVVVEKAFDKLTGMLESNKLDDASENGFKHYIEEHKKAHPELYYNIGYSYGFDMNDYFYTDIHFGEMSAFMAVDTLVGQIEGKYNGQMEAAMGLNASFVRQYIPTIQELPDYDLISSQYDVLKGYLPEFTDENANKIVFVVDEYNGLSDISLALLGYLGVEIKDKVGGGVDITFTEKESISYEELIGKEIYVPDNSQIYIPNPYGDGFMVNPQIGNIDKSEFTKLEIVGVLRVKKNVEGLLNEGFGYLPNLTEQVIKNNKKCDTFSAVEGTVNVYNPMVSMTVPEEMNLRKLALVDTPSEIRIYAKDFDSKEVIKAHIDEWNDRYSDNEELQITYSDMMSMIFGILNTMVDSVTIVLIAFTSISLVVSSVMIGIITYTSVVERTKEIGVLRALGASKKEISNVFNAETFLIGLFAGLIGVGFTYLVSIPLNLLLKKFIASVGKLVLLKGSSAIILVIISFALTMIAGLVPARIAAKKDPVVALRSE